MLLNSRGWSQLQNYFNSEIFPSYGTCILQGQLRNPKDPLPSTVCPYHKQVLVSRLPNLLKQSSYNVGMYCRSGNFRVIKFSCFKFSWSRIPTKIF